MLKFALLLVGIALCTSSPLPQRIEQEAEIIPARDIPEQPKRDRFPTIIVRTIPVRDIFRDILGDRQQPSFSLDGLFGPPRTQQSPFDDLFTRSIFGPSTRTRTRPVGFGDTEVVGGPDFVSVPAGLPAVETEQTEQDEIPLSATGDRPQFALDDFAGLQDRLLSTLFGSVFGPSSDSGRPLASLPSEQPSFLPPGLFEGGFQFPSLSNLPPNYENSSTREEEIDGHKVRIDETIHKKKTPLGSSVFHLKVYQINPDGSVSEREQPKARPATEKPIEQEQVTMKIPEAGKEDIPTITLNEPKEETPVVKEDFGPVVDNGRGVEEQIPDVSLNEIQ